MSSSEAAEADIDLADRKDPHTNMAVSKNVAEYYGRPDRFVRASRRVVIHAKFLLAGISLKPIHRYKVKWFLDFLRNRRFHL